MLYATVKLAVTALLIVVISEVGKRSSVMAAILASIPLVSVLAMIWLYVTPRTWRRSQASPRACSGSSCPR